MTPLPAGFCDVAASVYADDPCWIPEDPAAVARSFEPSNPWFASGEALPLVGDGCRVAGFHQPALRVDGRSVAFFGFWERAPDADDAPLFAAVERWARQRGAQDLYGPIDFTTYGPYRVLLNPVPGRQPFVGEPYNPRGYAERLEALGFSLQQSYLSQAGATEQALAVAALHRPTLEGLEREGYVVEPLTVAAWMERLPELHRMIDAIFGANFAYSPLSWPTFQRACGEAFIRKAHPGCSVVAWGPGGDLAGFFLGYADWSALCRQGAPDRAPADAFDFERDHARLLAANPRPEIVAKTVGVAPAHRRKGLMQGMSVALIERAAPTCDRWFAATIRADNPSRRYGEGMADASRWYGLFRKRLA